MKISTKGRYSLRLLLDLAEHANKGFIPLKDIAERQEISKKYLEQIVSLLNVSGMLRTNRGYQGGYMLAKPPGEYTVGQVLRITEGGIYPVACLENDPNICPRNSYCKTLAVWEGLNRVISEYLDGITLEDLMHGPLAPNVAADIAAPEAPETANSVPAAEVSVPETPNAVSATETIISAPPPERVISTPEVRQKSDRWFWNSF